MCLYPLYLNYLCLFFFHWPRRYFYEGKLYSSTLIRVCTLLYHLFFKMIQFFSTFRLDKIQLKLPNVRCLFLKKLFKLVKMTKQIKMVADSAHVYKFWEKIWIYSIFSILQERFWNYPTRPCHCCRLWLYYTFLP